MIRICPNGPVASDFGPVRWVTVMVAGLVALSFAGIAAAQGHACDDQALEGDTFYCVDEVDAAWALNLINRPEAERLEVGRRGDALIVVARADGDALFTCCSLQERMEKLTDDVFAAQFRMRRLDEAHLSFVNMGGDPQTERRSYFGPSARRIAAADDVSGTLEEFTVFGEALEENRRLVLYRPPHFNPNVPFALLVLFDGDGVRGYAQHLEPLMVSGALPQLAILGVPSGASAVVPNADYDFDVRAADYLPGFNAGGGDRFERHRSFVLDQALPEAEARLGASANARIIAGSSNGAVAALEIALSSPEPFYGAIVMSRGFRSHIIEPTPRAQHLRIHFSAGLYEPNFRQTTRRSVMILQEAGFDVGYADYVDGHATLQWRLSLVDGLLWLLASGE